MLKEAHFPYGHYIFQKESGEPYASSVPAYKDKKVNAALCDPEGKVLLDSIMSVEHTPGHDGLKLFTIYDSQGGIAAIFMKPRGIKRIGEEHYAVMVNDAAYLMLDDTSGRGNYTISGPAGRIAEMERTEKHLRRSSYQLKLDGQVDLPIVMESLVLAGVYTGLETNMLIESRV